MLKFDGPKSLFMRSVIIRVSCCFRLVIYSVKTLFFGDVITTNLDLSPEICVNSRGTKTVPMNNVSDHVGHWKTLVSCAQLGGPRKFEKFLAVK